MVAGGRSRTLVVGLVWEHLMSKTTIMNNLINQCYNKLNKKSSFPIQEYMYIDTHIK